MVHNKALIFGGPSALDLMFNLFTRGSDRPAVSFNVGTKDPLSADINGVKRRNVSGNIWGFHGIQHMWSKRDSKYRTREMKGVFSTRTRKGYIEPVEKFDEIVSPCHGLALFASLSGGIMIGNCQICYSTIVRNNPETGIEEWLDGKRPWFRKRLRKVIYVTGLKAI